MGTTMEGVQNAYRGFSRGNFTMLDNLALGFSGTKQGMQELLDKAHEISGIKYDISSYADMVEAIHVVQTEMKITGTTAKEAAETLQGSTASMKSAWENLITGLANGDADINQLMDDLLKSAETVGANLFPIVERAIDSIVKLLGDAIPRVLKDLPDKLDEYAPKILDAAEKITNGLLDVLPEFLDRIPKILEESLPKVMSAAKKLFKIIIQALPTLIKAFGEALSETLPIIIPELTNALKEIINVLTDPQFIKMLVDLTLQLITTVTNSLSDSLPEIIDSIVKGALTIIDALTEPEVLKSLVKAAAKLIIALSQGLIEALPQIIDALPGLVQNILTGLLESAPEIAEAGIQLFGSLVSNIPGIQARVIQAIPQIIAAIFASFASFGYDLGQKFYEAWEYVKEVFSPENVQQFFADVWNNIQEAFSGVSEFFQDLWYEITEIFSPVGEWFGNLFNDAWDNIQQAFANVGGFFQGIWNNIKNAFSGVANWFSNTFKAAWEGVKAVFSAGGRIFNGIKDGILNGFKVVVNGIIDGINTVVAVPFNGINTALRNIRGVEIAGFKPFDWIQEISVPQIPRLAEGGVLKRGQIALLEGEGAEAVIPLEKNTEWIDMIASRLNKKSEPQNIYYNVNVEVANMNANNPDEIETLADKLMSIMAEKSMRREVAFG